MTESIKEIKENDKQKNIDSLDQLKKDLSGHFADKIGPVAEIIGSDTIQDYFTRTGILDDIKDKGIISLAKNQFIDNQDALKILTGLEESRKNLLHLNRQIHKTDFSQRLHDFRKEFELSENYEDDYAPDEDCDGDDVVFDEDKLSSDQYDDREPRAKVFDAIKEIQEIDKKTPIKYKMWSRVIKEPNPSVDCSGLVCDIMRRSGFSIWDQTSRSLFTKFDAKKLSDIQNQSIDSQNLSKLHPGDLIYWDATDSKYDWKSSKIPTITVEWKKHRIHHVAVVTEKLSDGRLKIFESSWSKGVVERTLDPKSEFTSKSKSELYVSHMRYDALPRRKEAVA